MNQRNPKDRTQDQGNPRNPKGHTHQDQGMNQRNPKGRTHQDQGMNQRNPRIEAIRIPVRTFPVHM